MLCGYSTRGPTNMKEYAAEVWRIAPMGHAAHPVALPACRGHSSSTFPQSTTTSGRMPTASWPVISLISGRP